MSEQKHHSINRLTFPALVITLGIIYGDIGTSPLYVMDAILKEGSAISAAGKLQCSELLILGGISCILWTLTLQTTFKYIILTLRADNNGEGGIFSLFALVRKYRKWLYIPAIIGGCALLADGFITPPISVASAVEGLLIINPDIDTVPIVIIILTIIFAMQRWGSSFVGKAFGPIMFVWFFMLAILGVTQIFHLPSILKAVNPMYAYELLSQYPNGFWLLGAVFLCTTGAEALYSDLGHCGRINIRISWIFVKITLILNYFGQGAWLLTHRGIDAPEKVFYALLPPWFLLPGIAIATMAAIIASQALISGSFTLVSEAVRLNFWPKVAIKYPTVHRGQLYVPSINIILWVGCIVVTWIFQKSDNMVAAYGLAITLTMLMTTVLLTAWLLHRKVQRVIVYFLTTIFLTIEITFLIANLSKFQHGGFVTIILAALLFSVMFVWFKARQIQRRYIHYNDIHKYIPMLEALHADESVPKYAGNLVYLTNAHFSNLIEAKVINSIFKKRPKRADVYWLIHVHVSDEPHTMEYKVHTFIPQKFFRIDFNLGFRVEQRINMYFRRVIDEMVKNGEVNITSRHDSLKKYNFVGDFQFVVFERFLSYDNELPFTEDLMLDLYFYLKKLGLPTVRAFGLDNSVVNTETVPLVISQPKNLKIKRVE